MTKEQLFLDILHYLEINSDLFIDVKRDNRRKSTSVLIKDNGELVITYNSKDFRTYLHVFHTAYHEFGHLIYKDDETTQYNLVYAEYMAERWQLDHLKIDFPKAYKYQCERGKKQVIDWGTNFINDPHYVAWKMIKEYN